MEEGHMRMIGKCYGSTVVGPRGQLVIPADARRELGLDAGTKLLVFSHLGGRGFMFVKADAVEELLDMVSRRLDEFSKLLTESQTLEPAIQDEGNQG